MKKYNIIYADPPWVYKDKAGSRGVHNHYDLMSVEDICNLDIKSIEADDCILFLWVTGPQLNEGLKVLEAWGFTYKTMAFTWVKTTVNNKLFWGMGSWTRANPEFVLLGTKGHPKRLSKGILSVIMEPRREHSQKPDSVRDKIVELCGNLPRVELFARQKFDGWDSWGNEVESDLDFNYGIQSPRQNSEPQTVDAIINGIPPTPKPGDIITKSSVQDAFKRLGEADEDFYNSILLA